MMSVRNRIDTFEAHNEEVRKSSTPVSPKSPSVLSPHSSASGAAAGARSPRPPATTYQSSSPPPASTVSANLQTHESPDRPASETIVASQMRTNRLQRQQSGGSSGEVDSRSKNLQKTRRLLGVPDSGPHRQMNRSSPSDPLVGGPGASLFSHRRPADQFAGSHHGPSTSHLAISGSSSGGQGTGKPYSGQASSLSRKAAEHSRRRMLMQPRLNHEDLPADESVSEKAAPAPQRQSQLPLQHLSQPRPSSAPLQMAPVSTPDRGGNSFNSSANSLSNTRMGKIQRIKKMRNLDRQKSRDGMSTQESASLNPSSSAEATGNDDDITLTSVRQIAGSLPPPVTVERNKDSFRSASSPMSQASATKSVPDDETSQHLLARNDSGEDVTRTNAGSQHLQWVQPDTAEEKSDKAQFLQADRHNLQQYQHRYSNPSTRRQLSLQRSSSSELDETDGDRSRGAATPGDDRHRLAHGPSTSASQMTPDVAAFFERRRRHQGAFVRDDDSSSRRDEVDEGEGHRDAYEVHTFESANNDNDNLYDDDDNDSQGSMSYSRRREIEARVEQERARRKAAEAKSSEADANNPFAKLGLNNPFAKNEQVEELRKKYDTPTNRAAAGVAVASTVGFLVMGPVGLLVGAATVGIGAGVMQIPEEQRSNMCVKASEAVHGAHQTAIACTESLSNSCANTYENSVADHVPAEMKTCCTAIDQEVTKVVASSKGVVDGDSFLADPAGKDAANQGEPQGNKSRDGNANNSPSHRLRNKKNNVACLREGVIIPVSQIHALDPSAQPRAWLDVLASAETLHDEKMEAMEEILILAKDKQRARIFLEEGILDSIMWTLGRYLEKIEYNKAPTGAWRYPSVSHEEASSAKLAATCCLTLGKSHCAAIHTGGDLLLMSMYERGTVPEERQLAQLLHEVAFHARATKTDDPSVVEPRNEVFVMKQLSLPQAEELAQKIKAVAEGHL